MMIIAAIMISVITPITTITITITKITTTPPTTTKITTPPPIIIT